MDSCSVEKTRGRFLCQCLRLTIVVAYAFFSSIGWAGQDDVLVGGIRISDRATDTRVVFDISGPVEHNIFPLHNPERIVIDLKQARLSSEHIKPQSGLLVKNVRYGTKDQHNLRVVLDLNRLARPRSFLLPPAGHLGHRLVVDLVSSTQVQSKPLKSIQTRPERLRDVVIAIDAGHGGKDPGAIGRHGTKEKDIVLSVARKLEALINQEKSMRAVMIRNRDVFIPLRKRIEKARKHKADLFVSIHADAARSKRARGSSVYVLSQRGASSEHARWLAKRENDADLIGGVSLDDKDDMLASVLLDLSQTATIEASVELADDILQQLQRVGRVHSKRVEQAGFAVLKSPDIPSVLVETAFISNPTQEKRLRDKAHQQTLAKAMLVGIQKYFEKNAPPGTVLAKADRRHVIKRGETLTAIAKHYRIDVSALRTHNELEGDRIQVGQILLIPVSDS